MFHFLFARLSVALLRIVRTPPCFYLILFSFFLFIISFTWAIVSRSTADTSHRYRGICICTIIFQPGSWAMPSSILRASLLPMLLRESIFFHFFSLFSCRLPVACRPEASRSLCPRYVWRKKIFARMTRVAGRFQLDARFQPIHCLFH